VAGLLLLLLVVAPIILFLAITRNRNLQRRLASATVLLEVDEFGVRRELADGRREEIDWGEVREVEVMRTKRGPHAESGGVVILWGDDTRGCLVPIDRSQESGLLEALPRLPGLSGLALAEALGAEPESQLVVWRRES
jgi:hypothetical protein